MLRELSELEKKHILYSKIMAHAETPKLFWQAIKLSAKVDKRRINEPQIFIKPKRCLLKRYHSEAKSKRRTAFKIGVHIWRRQLRFSNFLKRTPQDSCLDITDNQRASCFGAICLTSINLGF